MRLTEGGLKIIQIILISILSVFTFSSQAIEKETVEGLTDENRMLSSAIELHLTSEVAPLVNSTVSLNHEDAWLFFDNIRPSDVIANFNAGILINGEVLINGGNGRVAMYANGTVVMPFGNEFKPLRVYSEEGFGGNEKQMEIHTYHNNLGEFDNAIKSFKLKRGYMATFANAVDGTGYSRVFIADKEDLEFSVMPEELYGTVSFIRVFKYEWVSKKGWAGWDEHEYTITNSTWRYDWNAGGTSTNDIEYTPIKQNLGWPSWSAINDKQNVTHLLGYNEPDHVEQSDVTVSEAIAAWPDFLKSGLRLGAPATTNFNWVIDFVKRCDELNYRVDYVAVHAYWGNDPAAYLNSLSWVHNATGRPIWITEWNYGANWTNEWWPDNTSALTSANEQYAYQKIKAIVDFFDQTPWIERYSIYNWVEDRRAIVLNGELTKAGEYYAENKSRVAYNGNYEVIPNWNYQKPELDFRYFSLRNSIRLSWEDKNGELSREFVIRKKVNDGAFETIYSSTDVSTLFYLDPLDTEISGTITYQMTTQTASGEILKSNEVSYFQTAGESNIQTGNFIVENTTENTTMFASKFSATPIVLLGIPSFNNEIPMSQRIWGSSKTEFRFNFYPWSYLQNPQLTKSELLSTLALPAGSHNFGGLQAEAKSVTGVTRNWISVTFDEVFEQVPAIFCTIASSSNFYPLTVAVRNVNTTGFEMSLKSEESITTNLTAETVNYFAIEPGEGVIGKKRVTVGRNSGSNGISSTPLEIKYDSTYTEPGLFAGLNTAEDIFASTLRYSKTGDSSFNLVKHREMSGETSEMNTDDLGWMVMDFAANQPDVGTGLKEFPLNNTLSFYPNPTKNTVHFNFEKPTHVEIFDLSGYKLIESVVLESINVSLLSSGIYFMKAEGYAPVKLIKIQ